MTVKSEKTSPGVSTAEADLAFLRGIVEGDNRGQMTMGVIFLAGGLLYGIQCLFHLGQIAGIIRWPGLASLIFVVLITTSVLAAIVWAVLHDRRKGLIRRSGSTVSRAMNSVFAGAGMANLAVIIVFGVGAMREQDFSIYLYYAAVVFAFQSVAWFMAWTLKRKAWMGLAAAGHWCAAVALGVLVREPVAYLWVCTAALFLLFALPGVIILREARVATNAA